MSRFIEGDAEEDYPNQWMLQKANEERALRGVAGQRWLARLEDALLALPEKRLTEGRLATEEVAGAGEESDRG